MVVQINKMETFPKWFSTALVNALEQCIKRPSS